MSTLVRTRCSPSRQCSAAITRSITCSPSITYRPSLLAGQQPCYALLSAPRPCPSTTTDPGTSSGPPPAPGPSPPGSRSPRHAPAQQQHDPDPGADTHRCPSARRPAGQNCQTAEPSGPSHSENPRQPPMRLTDHSRPHPPFPAAGSNQPAPQYPPATSPRSAQPAQSSPAPPAHPRPHHESG